MAKEYVHEKVKGKKPKVVQVPRVSRGIDPESSEGTIKDGPISRLVDGALSKLGL